MLQKWNKGAVNLLGIQALSIILVGCAMGGQSISVPKAAVAVPQITANNESKSVKDLVDRGNAKRQQKDFQGAIADFTQAIKRQPDFDSLYTLRGVTRAEAGDKKGAISDFNKVIQLKPTAKAYGIRGVVRAEAGDKKGAIIDLNQSIKLDPNPGFPHQN
jgi:Flp pilus assembly protein TadD